MVGECGLHLQEHYLVGKIEDLKLTKYKNDYFLFLFDVS